MIAARADSMPTTIHDRIKNCRGESLFLAKNMICLDNRLTILSIRFLQIQSHNITHPVGKFPVNFGERSYFVCNVVATIIDMIIMALEDEIKQEKFSSEYQKASINLLYTGSWLYNTNAAYLKQFGITPEQFNVLRILRGSFPKPMMLMEITERMIDKSSNCTRLVEKLKQKGLVSRETCERNRRQVDISITDKGQSLLKKIDGHQHAWIETMTKLSKVEAKELNRILDKLRG